MSETRPAITWTQAYAALGALVIMAGVAAWFAGGIHPQWSNDIAELRASNSALQADLKTAVAKLEAQQQTQIATAASDKAVLAARIDAAQQLFTSRLDAMWRPSDYADRDSHLSRLDAVYDAIRNRVTDVEYSVKDLTKQMGGLSSTPVRNPSR